ncbi:MAG: hypothetical protein KH614_03095, partial [Firmicutes bacterium]|nr:hypothetical protein [Bacillota bacterium]
MPATLSFLYYTWYRIWCQVVSAAGKNCRGHTAPAEVIPKEPLNKSAAALSGSFAPTYRFENLEILRSRWRL